MRRFALFLTLLAFACGEPDAPDDRPNVVLISIDALRKDHLGLYGYERDTSPYLDRLADESIVFDRAYCTASWTLISHMTMLTGLFGRQHGVVADGTALSPAIPTLAERLEAIGYHNIALYFPGWIHERFGHLRGFQDARQHERGPKLQANLKKALAERPTDKPFFLFLHIWDVHCQNLGVAGETVYDPPEGFDDLFLPDARERLEGIIASDMWMGRHKNTPEEIEAVVALYDGSIRYADSMIEGWVEGWREEGLLDNTLLIVTSDHGEGLAQRKRRLVGHGGTWEEGLAVPLIVRPPGDAPQSARGGVRRDVLTSHVDIVPTVLELVDRPKDRWLPGYSLFGEIPEDRMHLVDHPPAIVLYRWPYKVVMSQKTRNLSRVYDLVKDPGEETPVLERANPELFAEFHAELKTELDAHVERWGPLPGEAIAGQESTAEEVEALKSVGYFGDEEEDQ